MCGKSKMEQTLSLWMHCMYLGTCMGQLHVCVIHVGLGRRRSLCVVYSILWSVCIHWLGQTVTRWHQWHNDLHPWSVWAQTHTLITTHAPTHTQTQSLYRSLWLFCPMHVSHSIRMTLHWVEHFLTPLPTIISRGCECWCFCVIEKSRTVQARMFPPLFVFDTVSECHGTAWAQHFWFKISLYFLMFKRFSCVLCLPRMLSG